MSKQESLFEGARLRLEDSIDLSLASIREYGRRYRHWAVAYSGGKDSTATVTFLVWAIKSGLVPRPESLTVLYADTRMELPPLQQAAIKLLHALSQEGIRTQIVLPKLDERFFVYMLGRGVPPPKNRFRWCTPMLKIHPMETALVELRNQSEEKLLMITGVRLGESAIRDQRIALSCSKDSGECGQGWYQTATDRSIADTLAPLMHWRICHVYDWLYFEQQRHGFDVSGIALIYGEEDVRTGCMQCNLASQDKALKRLLRNPEWSYLRPILELKPLYLQLARKSGRKRKAEPEILKDGSYGSTPQRFGPLLMETRAYGLERVLDIQKRANVDLINAEEEARIREMWSLDIWPEKWSSNDLDGNVPIDKITLDKESGELIYQSLLVR